MLVLRLYNGLTQLRDGRNGSLVDTLSIPGFRTDFGVCQDSPNTVLISGRMGLQRRIMQCNINNNKITKGDKEIGIDIQAISGITCIIQNDRKILVATCGYSNTEKFIIAVDYQSGRQLWKISEPIFNGRKIVPWKICSDGDDYLFVTNSGNSRVVVMDTQGEIKQEICTDIVDKCWDVTCIPDRNKLIVSDDSENIYLYDIKYQN